jgi:hypothetical protein
MTRWYGPLAAIRTGLSTLISTTLGRHLDARRLEAFASPSYAPTDLSGDVGDGEFWIDYAADAGDGWNPTYAVASLLARPTLDAAHAGGPAQSLRRGQLLVLGGDLVYPTASRTAYEERLVQPFESALAFTERPHPHLFAIPGNHDWYDSLVSFSRLFLGGRWLGGWRTRQERSYFAVKLPYGWWLLGADIQLGSDIDQPQLAFFRKVAEQMALEDRAILCTAEPHWIYEKLYSEHDRNLGENNIRYLADKVFKERVAVYLAGDLHHYRRHEQPAAPGDHATSRQKIVAGGGGAFLHPTHVPDVSEIGENYREKAAYPPPAVSARLSWRLLAFAGFNPEFGCITGVLYALAYLAGFGAASTSADSLLVAFAGVVQNPWSALYAGLVVLGFFLFTDRRTSLARRSLGVVHGGMHVLAALGISCIAYRVSAKLAASGWESILGFALAGIAGAVVGAVLFGIYLLISLNLAGQHMTEAFSSLRIQDWKCFLKFRLRPDGDLTIYPIGIPSVPRRWKPRARRMDAAGNPEASPEFEPVGSTVQPVLIEAPIIVKRRPAAHPIEE